jgi:hypothetical protein
MKLLLTLIHRWISGLRNANGHSLWILLLVVLSVVPALAEPSWTRISDKNGITIYSKEVPGKSVPAVRAITKLNANIHDVREVIFDPERYPQWNPNCSKALVLKRPSSNRVIFYFLTDVPWPASDRDVVTSLKAVESGKDPLVYHIHIQKHDDALYPPKKGVQRVPSLLGHYRLTEIGAQHTQLEYVVSADTGGYLPGPLVSFFSVRAPSNLILGLKKQLAKNAAKKASAPAQ